MGNDKMEHGFVPDAHLEDDEILPDNAGVTNIEAVDIETTRYHEPERVVFPEENDNFQRVEDKYNAYATPEEIRDDRSSSIKKIAVVLMLLALAILVLSWFFKAINEIEQDEIRRVSQEAHLPQDLNMTTDSVLWQTAKDAEIEKLNRELTMLKTGHLYPDQNGSNQIQIQSQPQQQIQNQMSPEEIIALVKKELRNNGGSTSGLRAPPPLPTSTSMPKNIRRIAGNDGNKGNLSVDDFLTVPQNSQPQVPQTVLSAQNSGVQMLPPALNNGTPPPATATSNSNAVQIPNLASSQNQPAPKFHTKIVDAPDLKTGYVAAKSAEANKDKKPYYLMAGLAKATLHTGFRAPTLSIGEKSQQPVYMSVDSEVIAANDMNIDIQECTVMGTSRGNLNSGRAEIRLDELNCAIRYRNGKKGRITEKINGWVYGEDGVFGLKGRLVSSEGKILESAIPIALIQSLIGSLSQLGQSSQTISTVGTAGVVGTSTISSADQMRNGALSGFSQSMNQSLSQVVDYYVSILKELNPAIEILGGRNRLTILFKGGEELKEKNFEPLNLEKLQREYK